VTANAVLVTQIVLIVLDLMTMIAPLVRTLWHFCLTVDVLFAMQVAQHAKETALKTVPHVMNQLYLTRTVEVALFVILLVLVVADPMLMNAQIANTQHC
jgi:hypothetical protein